MRSNLLRTFQNATITVFSRTYITKVGVLGVPFDKGQSKPGVGSGPKALREAKLIERLRMIHQYMDVKDYGDVTYTVRPDLDKDAVPNMKKYAHMAACNFEVSKSVERIIKDSRLCITIGGDHAISLGSVDGHLKAANNNVSILWVDAHADLNTHATSESGNTHGMPMALLLKELADFWPHLPGMDWQVPTLSIRNIGYIGLRSVDAYERLVIEDLGIAAYGIEDVEAFGINSVLQMALNRIDPQRERSIHLSFDVDALDPLEAPCTGTPVRGGLTLREGVQIVEIVHRTGRLGCFDLVELNPLLGSLKDIEKSVEACIHIIQAACGYHRRGLRPYREASLPKYLVKTEVPLKK